MRYIKKHFKSLTAKKLAIIDSQFPQREPLGFRNTEINEYLQRIKNSLAFTMSPLTPGPEAWFRHMYGMDKATFLTNRQKYASYYPQNVRKIKYLDEISHFNVGLAYSFFLAETYTLLPIYEAHRIPFAFVLYPGGGFGLNNKSSDAMLRKLCGSPWFREVIVTQEITRDYLIKKKLCPASRISYIYGGFVQFKPGQVIKKNFYPQHKDTLDLCFVAAKYSEKGVDKGYDAFIEVAHRLAKKIDCLRFHVVGGFDERDCDVSKIRDKVMFYGYLKPDKLRKLYPRMDAFVAANKPDKLYEGNFDGFPLGIDAAYCGVALFVADELKMNRYYTNGKDIIILPSDIDKQVALLSKYLSHPEQLCVLRHACQQKTWQLFDIDTQIEQRLAVFRKYVTLTDVRRENK